MTAPLHSDPFEPERYELGAEPAWHFDLDRRGFFEMLGGGIVVALVLPSIASATAPQGGRPETVAAFLHIDANGAVTVYTGKVELGQDARTSLAQAVAEELRVPVAAIGLVMGDTDRVPYDRGTFGSQSTPQMAPQLRRAAAVARELLIDRAAGQLGVERAALTVADGAVRVASSGRSMTFGELSRGETLTHRIDASVALTPAERCTVLGTSPPKLGARDLVTGAHRFPYDVVRAGMLHGKVLRPAAFGARLRTLDDSAAKRLPDVRVVRDGDFVGVVAPSAHAAAAALAVLKAEWEVPDTSDDDTLWDRLRERAREGGRGRGGGTSGDPTSALAAAVHRLDATFTIPFIAHAPLEPRAAVAEWNDGKLTAWTGTQRPFGVRDELARAFGLRAEQVRVLMPDTGSGYGGKHTGDAALEAAALARAVGRPVAVRWTREEEFTWAYFRPAGVIDVRAGVNAEGRLVAWEFDNFNSGAAALEPPYVVPNQRCRFLASDSPLRQGSYRALAATANVFARESHVDDLAAAVGLDPVEFRRRNLDTPRLLAVLDAAAARAGWGAVVGAGRGRGIACGTDKGGYVATVADLRTDGDAFTVERLVTAFECGAIVHPDNLQNQIEGMAVQALGGALFESIGFVGGRIRNPRFSAYRVPRFRDVPELVTVLVDRRDLPSAGAGEAPMVAIAPAIRNALAAATGRRLRSLPLV